MAYHLFFEQSGTFKNELKKLNQVAYDYDILNDFGETDFQRDLFQDIDLAYQDKRGGCLDNIKQGETIIAFFPCILFEAQQILWFKGDSYGQRTWNITQKLEYNLKQIKQLQELYSTITKLAIVAYKKDVKLIIENPYNDQHFLTRYWCLKPAIIDHDRYSNGDYYTKPTQYWFINCEPKNNLLFDEPIACYAKRLIKKTSNRVERSMISKEYARRFIRTYILEKE